MKLTESQEQILLFEWAELNKREYPELELLYHIPNGGLRNKITATRLKKEGVKSGVPDLCLPIPKAKFDEEEMKVIAYHGIYIEMKAKKGKLSEKQDWWLCKLSQQGYKTIICYGFEEAKNVLLEYLR